MIGAGLDLQHVDDFNRRARIALRGVTFRAEGGWDETFAREVSARIEAGEGLTSKQQQALINLVHRYRAQITDALVCEYAALRARGHDAAPRPRSGDLFGGRS